MRPSAVGLRTSQVGPRSWTPPIRTERRGADWAAVLRLRIPFSSPPSPRAAGFSKGRSCEVEGRGQNGRGGEEGVVLQIATFRSSVDAAVQHPPPHTGKATQSTSHSILPLGSGCFSRWG